MKDHSSGRSYSSDFKLLSGLFFRLLPYQVLLIAINAVNNIIDRRRTYFASLSLEEMAGNVVQHGFKKDNKKNHSVDIRVTHRDDEMILRLRDDCRPFDPASRNRILEPEDTVRHIGIRLVYHIAEDIQYQNLLGLNVLTVRI